MILKEYNNTNNSFSRKLVYRIGSDAGFFSEYNNMIITMHYCLVNNIRFILNSYNANFSYNNGWTDYFLPFCKEDNNTIHALFNNRYEKPIIRGKSNKFKYLQFQFYLVLNNFDLLTYEVFYKARNQSLDYCFEIKELGLKNLLQENCRIINELVWKYKPEIQKEIEIFIDKLKLNIRYIGFHIRRGDKLREAEFIHVSEYIRLAEEKTEIKNAFIATDDYSVVEDLIKNFPAWNFYTLTKQTQRGYDQYVFNDISPKHKRIEMIELFATIEILSKSEFFIGTMSSNIGMYMGWRLPKEKCIGVDTNEWKIW